MSKPKYISGQKIIEQKDTEPIDFFNDYIKTGLQPHNQVGHPLSPADVLETIHDTYNLLGKATRMSDEDAESEEIIDKINKAGEVIGPIRNVDWEDFELPNYEPDAQPILDELLNAIYLRAEIKGLRPAKAMTAKPVGPKKRHSTLVREECIRIARRIWKKDPSIHKAEIARSKEIKAIAITKEDGKPYSEKVIRSWLRNDWPEPYLGQPKKRRKKS